MDHKKAALVGAPVAIAALAFLALGGKKAQNVSTDEPKKEQSGELDAEAMRKKIRSDLARKAGRASAEARRKKKAAQKPVEDNQASE